MRREVVLPFAPRPWQVPLLHDPAQRITAVVHRRAGKSALWIWRGLMTAMTHQRKHLPAHRRQLKADPVRVVMTLPEQVQWTRTGLWDRLDKAAKSIPGADVQKVERRVVMPNGAIFQTGGLDNPDGWRGGYADEIIVDEYDDTNAEGLVTAVEPMLADYEGTLIRSGTPKGLGKLKKAYDEAGRKAGHSRYLLLFQDTGVLSDATIARMRAEMTPEEFAQEFECSWDAPKSGSYYGQRLHDAQVGGRITRVPYDPSLPVWTSWDLGFDGTAIWFLQTPYGGSIRAIGYYEDTDESLDHYARHVVGRGYQWKRHLLPHDAVQRDYRSESKHTIEQTLNRLEVRPTRVVQRGGVESGINGVMMLLPRMLFDEVECAAGLTALRAYGREWNERMGVWKAAPRHDWASHGADALRTFADGHREEKGEGRRVVVEAHHDPHAR